MARNKKKPKIEQFLSPLFATYFLPHQKVWLSFLRDWRGTHQVPKIDKYVFSFKVRRTIISRGSFMTCKVMQPWKNSNDLFSKLYPDTPFVYECHENPASNTTFPSSSLMGSRVDDRLISLSLTSCVGVFENFSFLFFGNSLRHFPTKGEGENRKKEKLFSFSFWVRT